MSRRLPARRLPASALGRGRGPSPVPSLRERRRPPPPTPGGGRCSDSSSRGRFTAKIPSVRVPIVLILAWTATAACAEPTTVGDWITDLRVRPRLSRVDEGESARITFTVRDRRSEAAGFSRAVAPTIGCIDLVVSRRGTLGGERRTFTWTDPTPGHKVAIWDGTFEGRRDRPPEPGRYRVRRPRTSPGIDTSHGRRRDLHRCRRRSRRTPRSSPDHRFRCRSETSRNAP